MVSNCQNASARPSLTEWVSGNNSAAGRRYGGKSAIGKITPEKKNMGERAPVIKKLKWLIVFTYDVTKNPRVANINPVINPEIAAKKAVGSGTTPNRLITMMTAQEKKNPLVPHQKISPISKSCAVKGAPSIPSYTLSNSSLIKVP